MNTLAPVIWKHRKDISLAIKSFGGIIRDIQNNQKKDDPHTVSKQITVSDQKTETTEITKPFQWVENRFNNFKDQLKDTIQNKIKDLQQELGDKKVEIQNGILKCGNQELGQLRVINNPNAVSNKTLTVFYNHGKGGDFKKENDELYEKLAAGNTEYKTINYVRIKQGYGQEVTTNKLIDHFKNDTTEFATVGFSGGCTSSLQQEQLMQTQGITPKSVILTAPVTHSYASVVPGANDGILKQLEDTVFNAFMAMSNQNADTKSTAWQYTCAEALQQADKMEKPSALKIFYNKGDGYYKNGSQNKEIAEYLQKRKYEAYAFEGKHKDKPYIDHVVAELLEQK